MANTGAHANFTGNSASGQAHVQSGHVFGDLTNNYGAGYQARSHNGDINHNYATGNQVQNGDINHSYAAGARVHNGNNNNNTTYHYTLRQRRSDDTLTESSRNRALVKAAADGQTKRVEYLIRIGADIEYTDEYELTALHHAAFSGFEDTVDVLITAGCYVDAYSEDFGTPLCMAAVKNRVNVVSSLLAARANINSEGGQYGSPLHAACSTKDLSTIEILLERGAFVNEVRNVRTIGPTQGTWKLSGDVVPYNNHKDCAPIVLAAEHGTPATVSALIKFGASVTGPYQSWKSTRTWEHAPLSERWSGNSPLFAARDPKILQVLLNNGADPNAIDDTGKTLLTCWQTEC